MEKFERAVKATCIVLGFCCAGLLAAILVGLAKAAKSVFLLFLAVVAPFVAFGLAVYLVYRFLGREAA